MEYGFRSPIGELNRANPRLGVIEEPLTLDDLGGARKAERKILPDLWRERVLAELGLEQ